jgi:hypothetical protein
MTLLTILIASIISGVCYRLGGGGHGRLWRVFGVPFCVLLAVLACFGVNLAIWWAYVITFGATAGAVSAYYQQDEKKWGYWAHGLGLALALLPIAFVTHHWLGFSIRCLFLTGAMTLWSQFTKWDVGEEFGRGFIITASIPLLFL